MSRLVTYDPARTLDSTSLTGTYQDVGAVMGSPVLGFVIYNTSDVDIQVSLDDGTTDGPIIPSSGTFSDWVYNQRGHNEDGEFLIENGAQIQAKQVTGAGTSGDLIINIVRRR